MNPLRILAIVLIVAGILALVYGGFTYTSASHDLKIGNMEMSVKNKDTLNIPVWIGVARSWPARHSSSCVRNPP